jgi:hypothetical protein
MKKLSRLLCICSFLVFASCEFIADNGGYSAPPYVISKPLSFAGKKTGYYVFAGIEFTFLNTGGKTVSEVTVSCMLFDAETLKNPFIGSNIVTAGFSGNIPGGGKKDLVISLDRYIYVAPEKPYVVDFFYVSRITYTDGTVWEDRNGIYHTKGG